jgi:mRNA interferase MazF
LSRLIVLARMPGGETRPVLMLTREAVQPHLNALTVAPITARIRGLQTEVPVGVRNGLDHESVVNLDNISTVPIALLGRRVGFLFEDQEDALSAALIAAFDLEVY